jgi:hypothetical protein
MTNDHDDDEGDHEDMPEDVLFYRQYADRHSDGTATDWSKDSCGNIL